MSNRLCFLCILIIILLLLTCSVSCSLLPSDDDTDLSILDIEGDEEPFANRLYIVVPKNCAAALSLRAKELTALIYERTNVEAVFKYDFEEIARGEGDMQLLLGLTDRQASLDAMRELKAGEYVCRYSQGDIVLGGRRDVDTLEAIDRFISEILGAADNSCLMADGAHFENREVYDITSVRLNGYDLYDYSIVYEADNANDERRIAELMRDYVADRSGYCLNVVSASDKSPTVKAIRVGVYEKNGSDELICVKPDANGVALCGKGSFELSLAAVELLDSLFGKVASGKAELQLDGPILCENINLGSFLVCSVDTERATGPYNDYLCFIADELRREENALAVFGLTEREFAESIAHNLEDKYASLLYDAGEEQCYPVFYNTERISDIECKRTGGVFTVKAMLVGWDKPILFVRPETETDCTVLLSDEAYEIIALDATRELSCKGVEILEGSASETVLLTSELRARLSCVGKTTDRFSVSLSFISACERYCNEYEVLAKALYGNAFVP